MIIDNCAAFQLHFFYGQGLEYLLGCGGVALLYGIYLLSCLPACFGTDILDFTFGLMIDIDWPVFNF